MADGPKNSARYRLYKSRDMLDFDEPDAQDLKEDRYGEVKSGKRFTFGKEHQPKICGVSWEVDPKILEDYPAYFPDEVSLVKPKRGTNFPIIGKDSCGDDKRMPVVDCIIKIQWFIHDVYVYSWETRQTVRRLWGGERADNGIYTAAKTQEEKYMEWKLGHRLGKDQSPTPFLEFTPELTPDRGDREDREETPAPEKGVHFNPGSLNGDRPAKKTLADWKKGYFEVNELNSKALTAKDRAEMTDAWTIYIEK
jgi:hypothetical protein